MMIIITITLFVFSYYTLKSTNRNAMPHSFLFNWLLSHYLQVASIPLTYQNEHWLDQLLIFCALCFVFELQPKIALGLWLLFKLLLTIDVCMIFVCLKRLQFENINRNVIPSFQIQLWICDISYLSASFDLSECDFMCVS